MAKYNDQIIRGGLSYYFESSHESKWTARIEVRRLKEKSRYNTFGGWRGRYVTISTRIIKTSNGRYAVYSRSK